MIVLSGILMIGVNSMQSQNKFKGLIGQTIPALTSRSLINQKPLVQNIKESTYILHIFSSWCEHCITEHRKLMNIAANQNIPLYAIATKDNALSINTMLSQLGNPFKDIALDTSGILALDLGIRAIPETIIIKNNTIIDRFPGGAEEKLLTQYFSK